MAESAIGPEGRLVRVFVAARTQLCGIQDLFGFGDRVTACTFQICMTPGEKIAAMRLRRTRGAIRIEGEERTAGMAVRAVPRRVGMVCVERKPGFLTVIEAVRIKGSDVVVATPVLDVTHHAVVAVGADLAVDAATAGDPVGDQVVTDETVFGQHGASRTVTGVASPILELRVNRTQGAGSRQRSFVLGCGPHRGGGEDDQPHQDDQEIRIPESVVLRHVDVSLKLLNGQFNTRAIIERISRSWGVLRLQNCMVL